MARGPRDSQWLVIRRCLDIVHRAQRGPATWHELVQAVLAADGPDAYGQTEGRVLHRRLENDLGRIRASLGIDLRFDRRAGDYIIRDAWRPLLDLPDEDLAALAWLEQTFGPESPQHDEVRGLIDRLRLFLGVERQGQIEQVRTALALDIEQRVRGARAWMWPAV